jgi:uncharacterized protein YggU (UPF0235/DUF167 family)
MNFLEKKSNVCYIFTIYVKPNSRNQEIAIDGDYLTISLKSKARRNKANKELIKLLRDRLNVSNNQIRFLSGLTVEDKIIQINFDYDITEKEICNKLLDEN